MPFAASLALRPQDELSYLIFGQKTTFSSDLEHRQDQACFVLASCKANTNYQGLMIEVHKCTHASLFERWIYRRVCIHNLIYMHVLCCLSRQLALTMILRSCCRYIGYNIFSAGDHVGNILKQWKCRAGSLECYLRLFVYSYPQHIADKLEYGL